VPDIFLILWVPLTIAVMAIAFVVTLGAAGGVGPDASALAGSAGRRNDDLGR
jgi:hypothetical protein